MRSRVLTLVACLLATATTACGGALREQNAFRASHRKPGDRRAIRHHSDRDHSLRRDGGAS